MSKFAVLAGLALILVGTALPVAADDWVAVKLRGGVFVFTEGVWTPLKRGDVVSDTRAIQTQRSGHVVFQRDAETIDVGANTMIQIIDRKGQRFTTVKQTFGEVAIEAEVQNVKHFEVRTPSLAAVVKGTHFTVRTDGAGSEVRVQRGHVAVEDSDTRQTVTIAAGQSAGSGENSGLEVHGSGNLPQVVDASGRPVEVQQGNNNNAAVGRRSENQGQGNSGDNSGSGNSDNSGSGSLGGSSNGGGNGNGGGSGGGGGSNSGGNGGNSGGGSDNGNSGSGNSGSGNSGNGGGSSGSGDSGNSGGGGSENSGGGNGGGNSGSGNGGGDGGNGHGNGQNK